MAKISNPYLGLKVPAPENYLFGSKSSGYETELNNYNNLVSAREWEAQLALMDDEREYQEYVYNKYNTPSAQTEQMRAAGLNPDLQNISSNGFSSSPSSPPSPNTPSMVSGQMPLPLEIFMNLPRIVSMVSSMSSSFISNANALHDLDKRYEDMAFQDALDMYTPDDIVDGVLQSDKPFPNGQKTAFDRRLFDFEADNVSKRHQRRYMREFDNLVNGSSQRLINAIYTLHATGASERSRFINILGQHGYNMPDKDFAKVVRDLNKILYETDEASAKYTQDNLNSKAGTKFKSSGMTHINNGDYFVGILEYFLGMFLDGQFHASRSSGPKGSSTTFGY